MATSHRIAFDASLGIDEVARRVALKLQQLHFTVKHAEEFTQDGKRVLLIFGISSPLRGSGFLSAWFHGMRYVPFLVRAKEVGSAETNVLVCTGGAETWIGLDFGRNKGVAEWILDGLPGTEVDAPVLPGETEDESVPPWRDSAPGL